MYSIFLALYVTLLVWVVHFLSSERIALIVAIGSGIVVYFYERFADEAKQRKFWLKLNDELPPELVVGSPSDSEFISRISHLWVDREQMSMVLSEIREGVVAIDSHRNVILANERADLILQSQGTLIQGQIDALNFPVTVNSAVDTALQGKQFEGFWKVGNKPVRRYYEVVGLPMREQQGVLLVLRDITKIRRLERVRRDFIANISHELRTPITIVRANAETLLNGAMDDPEFGPRFLSAILRNGERLSRLINDLLDLSQIEAGQYDLNMRQCLLSPIVSRVIETLKENHNSLEQKIVVDVPEEVVAFVDEQAFEQILTNYIENAIKYSGQGAVIIVRIRCVGEVVLLQVEDNGPGILPKHRNRLFERFYRVDKGRSRDAGGTGLGLSIVRHLAEVMDGEVGMQPAPDTGSIFWCQLLKNGEANQLSSFDTPSNDQG
jgi:two-component system, OmpR family, phosphate regulon sensor histidine kinase PhoR